MTEQKPTDVVEILGAIPNDAAFSTWRVRLRDGTITTATATSSSSTAIDATLADFSEVFEHLAKT
jgi:hypothetical protein